jgi:pectinesterase
MAVYNAAMFCTLLLLCFSGLSRSDDAPPSTPVSPSDACNATTDPSFCRSVLPPRGRGNLYTYGRFSVAESLAGARRFAALVDQYLARHRHLPGSAVGALRDCQLMAELNIDFLSAAGATIQSSDTLADPQADDVHTLLSAIVTNQETCFDGLRDAAGGERAGLDAPIVNGTKMYSLSLSLFTRAWVPTAKGASHKGRHGHGHGHGQSHGHGHGHGHGQSHGHGHGHGHGQSRGHGQSHGHGHGHGHEKKKPHHGHGHGQGHGMKKPPSSSRRGLFDVTDEEMVRRMAMEGPERTVAVNSVVTVDQSGAGNFTTVGDAVAAAPKYLDGSKGYHVIYVLAGVYGENVVVSKHYRYIMMIGDGVGRTVITGNRSVVDGWTTFRSATFGTYSLHLVFF